MAARNISFDSVNLQDGNVITKNISFESVDNRNINFQSLGRDGGKAVDEKFEIKSITVNGIIKDTSASNLDDRIDDLKRDIMGVLDRDLDIDYISGTRRYVASCTNFLITREFYNLTYVEFQAVFSVVKPFAKDIDTTTGEYSAITTAERDSIEIGGSAKPLPKLQFTINSETDLTQIEFKNTTTGDTITINEDFENGDVLIIDMDELSITLNGDEVDYTGSFPEFETGWNDFYVWFEGTAYDVDLKIIYYKLWL